MVGRILLDNDKLVISKAGNEVTNQSLDDTNKIFDSRWPFTKFLLHSGELATPVTFRRDALPPTTITFPDVGSQPYVHLEFYHKSENTFVTNWNMLDTSIPGYPDQVGNSNGGSSWEFQANNFQNFYNLPVAEYAMEHMDVRTNQVTISWKSSVTSNLAFSPIYISWFVFALPQ